MQADLIIVLQLKKKTTTKKKKNHTQLQCSFFLSFLEIVVSAIKLLLLGKEN